jgi:hypothetical protein
VSRPAVVRKMAPVSVTGDIAPWTIRRPGRCGSSRLPLGSVRGSPLRHQLICRPGPERQRRFQDATPNTSRPPNACARARISMADRKQEWPADRVERWPIDRLIPFAKNARTHTPAQIAEIAASIREWGWTSPVLADEDGSLIAGHGRILAARQLDITEIPVMVARGWTDAEKRAYRIADNKLALNAGWDPELLLLELGEVMDLPVSTGLSPNLRDCGAVWPCANTGRPALLLGRREYKVWPRTVHAQNLSRAAVACEWWCSSPRRVSDAGARGSLRPPACPRGGPHRRPGVTDCRRSR